MYIFYILVSKLKLGSLASKENRKIENRNNYQQIFQFILCTDVNLNTLK